MHSGKNKRMRRTWIIICYFVVLIAAGCQNELSQTIQTPSAGARQSEPPSPTPLPSIPPSPTTDYALYSGQLLFSSRQIDTNGDGFVQVPDAIQIYKMDLEVQTAVPLTTADAYHTYPAWSPDGSQIAYVSTESEGVDLFLMDENGNNPQQLTADIQRVSSPSWSPDGQTIVFSGGDATLPNLFTYRLSSGEIIQLTDSDMADLAPDWSENGRFILFNRTVPIGSNNSGEAGLYILDLESGDIQKINHADQSLTLINGRWLPESSNQFLAQELNAPNMATNLYTLVWNDGGPSIEKTAVLQLNALEYFWINDTRKLTVQPSGETSEIVHSFLDRGVPRTIQLTRNTFFESNLDWKP